MYNRLTIEQRLKIQYLQKKRHTYEFIANEVGCTTKTVKIWSNKEFGNIEEKTRTGRKYKVGIRTKRKIVREILNYRTSLQKLGKKYGLYAPKLFT